MPENKVVPPNRGNREAAELYVVMICGLLLVVYKLSLHYAQVIQEFFLRFTTVPVADLITNALFVVVVILLWHAHGRWKRSLAREKEVERVLSSIRQEVIMTVGRDRRIAMCNEAVHAMYGYTPQEVIGKTTEILYYDRRSTDSRDSVFHSLEDVGFHVGEATGRRKNGEEFVLEIVTGDLKGGPGAVVLLRDVTELKAMATKIAESETRYRRMFELSPEAIITITPDGIVSAVNERVTDWLGYSPEEIVGLKLSQMPFLSPEGLSLVGEKFTLRMRGEDVPPYDLEFSTKDGQRRTGSIQATPIIGENGMPIEELVVISDVTLERRAEETIRRARDAAIESAELKSQFLANMSHEIRTPMNGIITVAQLALGTEMTPEQREYLETIADSSRTLLRIINDILDFSKLEAGKLEFQDEPFALRDAVVDALRPQALHASGKGVEVVASIDPELPEVIVGDSSRLGQILTNLVGNAVKFTAEGEVVVAVMLEEENADSIVLRFEVRDTGIGIPEGRLGTIFEAFSQADASTSRQYGGTGLGLSISAHLVEILEGDIGVNSVEGAGSTFWFTARFRKAGEAIPAKQIPEALSCRTLVAAPSKSLRTSLTKLLDAWNCPYTEAPDAATAWQVLRDAASGEHPFDVMLVDASVASATVEGSTLAHKIAAEDRRRGLKAVEIVPLAEFEESLSRGAAAARLATPVRASDLYNTLLFVLGRESLHTHVSPPGGFAPRQIAPPAGRNWQILLAEDNATNQKVALAILKKAGLTADVVANGEEAIAALSERDYDVVLMDVQMPIMDGFEAMQRIRDRNSTVRNHDIPAVAMTAHAMKGDRERCLKAGMTDYVSKPIDPDALVAILARRLSGDSMAAPVDLNTEPAPAPESDGPICDREGALRRMGGDTELLAEVIEIYREDTEEVLSQLSAAIGEGHTTEVRLHAHTIKGSSGNVGAIRAQELAGALEYAARDDRLADIDAHGTLEQLKQAVAAFLAETA
jgi:two-component system sensor histidine kinase/response regulator